MPSLRRELYSNRTLGCWMAWVLLVAGLSNCAQSYAFGPYRNISIVKVKDGDTVSVLVEVWPDMYRLIDVRVVGVDTPETRRGKKSGIPIPECEILLGHKAKEFTEEFVAAGKVSLENIYPKKTKYNGRISGDLAVNGQLLSVALLETGNAIPYNGGKRKIWPCEEDSP